MGSTLDDELMEGQLASLEEQLSNLAREVGVNASDRPASIKTFRAPLATIHRLANWRYVAFVGSLLAASIGVAAWWWSSSAHTAMMAPSDPAPLTQAAPEAVAPKDAAPTAVALSSDLAQQLQPMTRDLAALRQAVEQLKVRQEQLVRDNENVASQLKASQEEMARNNNHHRTDQGDPDTDGARKRDGDRAAQRKPRTTGPRHRQRVRAKGDARRAKGDARNTRAASAAVANGQPLQQATARPQAKKPQPSSAWPWSVR